MKKNREIERLRAAAVIMVAIAHTTFFDRFLPPPFHQSWSGVDLFFVISGFVVSRSFLGLLPDFTEKENIFQRLHKSGAALRDFYAKRIFRILPLALLWMGLPLLALFFFNKSGAFGHLTRYQAYCEGFSALTFQYNYAYIYGAVPGLLGYYWSLSVEEHFYLLLPLFLIFVRKDTLRLGFSLGIVMLIVLVIRPFVPFEGDKQNAWLWYRFASHNRFDNLFLGVSLGLISLHGSKRQFNEPRLWSSLTVVAAFFCLFALWLLPGGFLQGNFPEGLILTGQAILSTALVLIASWERGFILQIPFLSKILEIIGARSYAIYLIHVPAAHLVSEFEYREGLVLSDSGRILLWILFTVVFVEMSHQLLEKPAIRFIHRVSNKSMNRVPALYRTGS